MLAMLAMPGLAWPVSVPSPGQPAVRPQQCSQVPGQGPKLFPPSSNPHADSAHQVSSVPALLQLVPVQELREPSQAVPRGCAPTLAVFQPSCS